MRASNLLTAFFVAVSRMITYQVPFKDYAPTCLIQSRMFISTCH